MQTLRATRPLTRSLTAPTIPPTSDSQNDHKRTARPRNVRDHKDQSQPQEISSQQRKSIKDKSAVDDERKWYTWSRHGRKSPFPDFASPTQQECEHAYRILNRLHGKKVQENFASDVDSSKYPHVMDAVVVAALSQATSWNNAKRAMKNMDQVYGSTFAYDSIVEGGVEKLRQALRPGGMQNRKATILLELLGQVKKRHGQWDLDFLFDASDDEVMRELLRYKGIGPKCAHCVMSICLNRTTFALDTHCHRIAGFWGWRPESVSKEQAQAHLDARIPNSLKFALHYLLIVHGQDCSHCRGSGSRSGDCEVKSQIRDAVSKGVA